MSAPLTCWVRDETCRSCPRCVGGQFIPTTGMPPCSCNNTDCDNDEHRAHDACIEANAPTCDDPDDCPRKDAHRDCIDAEQACGYDCPQFDGRDPFEPDDTPDDYDTSPSGPWQ